MLEENTSQETPNIIALPAAFPYPEQSPLPQTAAVAAAISEEPLVQAEAASEEHEPIIIADKTYGSPISVCFAGVGTCGVNILMSLKEKNPDNNMVDFVGMNTDGGSIKELEKRGFANNIALNLSDSHQLGAGGDLEFAKKLGEKYYDQFKKRFNNVDLALVVTGMGGGTGTGVAPFVAKAAKEAQEGRRDTLTIGVTTMPGVTEFDRYEIASQGIEELKKYVDAIVVIDQMNIPEVANEDASEDENYALIDSRFQTVLQSIMDTVTRYTKRNIDFADVCSTLKNCGEAIITTIEAPSEEVEDIKKELDKAINDKLLTDHKKKVASRLLVYHFYGVGYSAKKSREIIEEVQKLFGWTKIETHGQEVYSCVIKNPPEGMGKFSKIGNDSGENYQGRNKVIVMAGGFVDKASDEKPAEKAPKIKPQDEKKTEAPIEPLPELKIKTVEQNEQQPPEPEPETQPEKRKTDWIKVLDEPSSPDSVSPTPSPAKKTFEELLKHKDWTL